MSVTQWTPEISRPTTMNAENNTANAPANVRTAARLLLRSSCSFSVGMTLSTKSVVDDG